MTASSKVLNVKVGETLQQAGKRAADAMRAAAAGKAVTPYFGISFQQVGQVPATFTPTRRKLTARLREVGPMTVAESARHRGRNRKNLHPQLQQRIESMAIARGDDGRVRVPWSQFVATM